MNGRYDRRIDLAREIGMTADSLRRIADLRSVSATPGAARTQRWQCQQLASSLASSARRDESQAEARHCAMVTCSRVVADIAARMNTTGQRRFEDSTVIRRESRAQQMWVRARSSCAGGALARQRNCRPAARDRYPMRRSPVRWQDAARLAQVPSSRQFAW